MLVCRIVRKMCGQRSNSMGADYISGKQMAVYPSNLEDNQIGKASAKYQD